MVIQRLPFGWDKKFSKSSGFRVNQENFPELIYTHISYVIILSGNTHMPSCSQPFFDFECMHWLGLCTRIFQEKAQRASW